MSIDDVEKEVKALGVKVTELEAIRDEREELRRERDLLRAALKKLLDQYSTHEQHEAALVALDAIQSTKRPIE